MTCSGKSIICNDTTISKLINNIITIDNHPVANNKPVNNDDANLENINKFIHGKNFELTSYIKYTLNIDDQTLDELPIYIDDELLKRLKLDNTIGVLNKLINKNKNELIEKIEEKYPKFLSIEEINIDINDEFIKLNIEEDKKENFLNRIKDLIDIENKIFNKIKILKEKEKKDKEEKDKKNNNKEGNNKKSWFPTMFLKSQTNATAASDADTKATPIPKPDTKDSVISNLVKLIKVYNDQSELIINNISKDKWEIYTNKDKTNKEENIIEEINKENKKIVDKINYTIDFMNEYQSFIDKLNKYKSDIPIDPNDIERKIVLYNKINYFKGVVNKTKEETKETEEEKKEDLIIKKINENATNFINTDISLKQEIVNIITNNENKNKQDYIIESNDTVTIPNYISQIKFNVPKFLNAMETNTNAMETNTKPKKGGKSKKRKRKQKSKSSHTRKKSKKSKTRKNRRKK